MKTKADLCKLQLRTTNKTGGGDYVYKHSKASEQQRMPSKASSRTIEDPRLVRTDNLAPGGLEDWCNGSEIHPHSIPLMTRVVSRRPWR